MKHKKECKCSSLGVDGENHEYNDCTLHGQHVCPCGAKFDTPQGLGLHFKHGKCKGDK